MFAIFRRQRQSLKSNICANGLLSSVDSPFYILYHLLSSEDSYTVIKIQQLFYVLMDCYLQKIAPFTSIICYLQKIAIQSLKSNSCFCTGLVSKITYLIILSFQSNSINFIQQSRYQVKYNNMKYQEHTVGPIRAC